jgi:acetyl esterase/lipase
MSAPFPLWPGRAPGARSDTPADRPTLTTWPADPAASTGATMVILPGGGYGALAAHEGEGYARWMARHGVTCHVLQYRLGSHGYRHPVMLHDAARALRVARTHARESGLAPDRVGIMGSSAGGHLAATLLTHWEPENPQAADAVDRESSRPDLGILCYPVITLGPSTHAGSRANLLGENPDPHLVEDLSNEQRVNAQTPPCFLWHTADDAAVPVENSLLFAAALRRAGVPFALHVYERGPHGLGLPEHNPAAPAWDTACLDWLRLRGFVR